MVEDFESKKEMKAVYVAHRRGNYQAGKYPTTDHLKAAFDKGKIFVFRGGRKHNTIGAVFVVLGGVLLAIVATMSYLPLDWVFYGFMLLGCVTSFGYGFCALLLGKVMTAVLVGPQGIFLRKLLRGLFWQWHVLGAFALGFWTKHISDDPRPHRTYYVTIRKWRGGPRVARVVTEGFSSRELPSIPPVIPAPPQDPAPEELRALRFLALLESYRQLAQRNQQKPND